MSFGALIAIITLVSGIVSILWFIYTLVAGGNSLNEIWHKRTRYSTLRKSLLVWNTKEFEYIDTRGIESDITLTSRARLGHLYTPPFVSIKNKYIATRVIITKDPVTGVARPIKVKGENVSSLRNVRYAVVLGDAGTGKTTMFKYFALTISARELLEQNEILAIIRHKNIEIPIFCPLRELAYLVEQNHDIQKNLTSLLAKYLSDILHDKITSEDIEYLFMEQDVFLLLDGLDEVADSSLRILLVELIERAVRMYPKIRCWVSSRPSSYIGASKLGGDFIVLLLQPFNQAQIARFLFNWYYEMELNTIENSGIPKDILYTKAQRQATELIISLARYPWALEIASNPLMLTAIAIGYYSKQQVPDRKVELMETCTQALLGGWDIAKPGYASKTITWPASIAAMSIKARRTQLEYIAWAMYKYRKFILSLEDMANVLVENSPRFSSTKDAYDKAEEFIEALIQRGGLLVEAEPNKYSFVHHGFASYLAGRRFSRMDDYVIFVREHASDRQWQEVIKDGAAYQSSRDPERAIKIIRCILENENMPVQERLLIVSEILCESDMSALDANIIMEVRNGIVSLLTREDIDIKTRCHLGLLLGHIGDPRSLDQMVFVPTGVYTWGTEAVHVNAFYINKFPVINSQYKKFIDEEGYSRREFWSEEGWKWKETNNIRYPFYWRDSRYNAPNQPVVGVSWYEAVAYANWKGLRLPTEIEWEAAARGPKGLLWPWGNTFAEDACNYNGTGISRCTPVGLFPKNRSPFGVWDLSGNIWEWTMSTYMGAQQVVHSAAQHGPKILKGGSWFSNPERTRTISRRWLHPGARQFNFGFRLVKSYIDKEKRLTRRDETK